ncbi:parallel beta-helix repeat (two copies) [Friedmanniella luteola]|uniref:Parallel beta-helix repeat (Two copies) n=1 Tax=Friedmanniella luteola TaxID=546871 RepID=A0A1H1LMC8_9ACTN|nr:right-handed parallel beta-helix repeat-containing protein [Friedmanniella luteola]SDR75671.1 parallel beta-helix repeat (two copies) [Friedmanniella luteola]
MSSRAHQRWTRGSVVGLVVAALVLLLLLGVVLVDRRSSGGGTTAEPTYRDGRVVLSDTFERSLDTGWGDADVGGPYELTSASDFSVERGTGRVTLPRPAVGHIAALTSARPQDLTASVDVIAPEPVRRGSGVYVALHLRTNGPFYYRPVLRFGPDQKVYLSLSRFDGSAEDRLNLANEKVVASGVQAGARLTFTAAVTGVTPVTIRAAVASGGRAPSGVEVTDASASRLAAGGTFALWAYVAGSSDADKVVGFDNLNVRQQVAETPGREDGTGSIGRGGVVVPAGQDGTVDAEPADDGRADRPTGSAPVGSTRHPVPAGALVVSRGAAAGGDGSLAAPFRRIQDAVDRVGAGGTVVVRAGSYHESVVLPIDRTVHLQSYPGEPVWLDGSSALRGWQRRGDAWEVRWTHTFDSSPTYTRGAEERDEPGWRFVNPAHPMAAHPEQVWVDGQPQTQVRTRAEVTEGTFFVDSRRQRLVLGTDPVDAGVRASTLAKGLTVVGKGDTVRGIGVRRYATSVWQLGAATVNNTGVSLSDMVFEDNATTGLSVFAADVTLRDLTASRNGLMGLHAHQADHLDVRNVVATHNNLELFNRAPAAGGMKLTSSRHVRVEGSEFADNLGHGLWFDAASYDVDIVSSRAERNTGAGMVVEISSRVRVVDNVLVDNGVHGLWLIDTDRVQIANNTFARNDEANLVVVTDGRTPQEPGPGGTDLRHPDGGGMPWVSQDVAVYNNVFADGGEGCLVCVVDHTGKRTGAQLDVAFDHNLYHLDSVLAHPTFATWPSAEPNPFLYGDFTAYRVATDQDAASRQLVGGDRAVDRDGRVSSEVADVAAEVARDLDRDAADAAAGAAPARPRLGAWQG